MPMFNAITFESICSLEDYNNLFKMSYLFFIVLVHHNLYIATEDKFLSSNLLRLSSLCFCHLWLHNLC
jgi:hypothetical protein